MRPFSDAEEALFEEASTTCNRRHQIQGDKAVRRCIEEEMTRMINEKQDLYEMCPHDDESGGMEIELPMGGEEMIQVIDEPEGSPEEDPEESALGRVEDKLDQILDALLSHGQRT